MENIISVSDLSFGYDSKRKVLENINFQLKKGESVGLVALTALESLLFKNTCWSKYRFSGDVMVTIFPLKKRI